MAATDMGKSVVDEHGQTAYVVALANGLRIHSMSSTPNCHAGKRGDRILDEFALHSDPKQLYAIAYPGLTWGGSLEIFSTHRGTHIFFNELIQEITLENQTYHVQEQALYEVLRSPRVYK